MNTVTHDQLASIPYNSQARMARDLIRRTKTFELQLDLVGTVQVAGGAADGALIAEQPLTWIRNIRVLEAGKPTVEWDPRALRQQMERESAKPATGVQLTSGAIQGPTEVRMSLAMLFAHPLAINPGEVLYVVRDPEQEFQLEIEWAPDLKAATVSNVNDRVWTFTNVRVEVLQVHDPFAADPFFIPRVNRQDGVAIVGNQTNYELPIKSTERLRSVLLHALGDELSRDDIVNFVSFKGDGRLYADRVRRRTWMEREQRMYGGATDAPGYYFYNWQHNGKLSTTWDPSQDSHPRFVLDVTQPGGVVTAIARAYVFELIQIAGKTVPFNPRAAAAK